MNKLTNKDRQSIFYDTVEKYVPEKMINWLIANGFFVKPASISHHSNHTGGLFDHSFETMQVLVDMTRLLDLKWQQERSPYIVGMFHDLCKIDDYIDANMEDVVVMGTGSPISKSPKWVHNNDAVIKGHGDKSIILLSQFMTLTEEEIMCIKFHMGAYETSEWAAYDKAIRKYETVLWTHTADMYASKVNGV